MTRHYQAEKHGPCLRCGMTYENMNKRHRLNVCRGDNLDKDGKPYPDPPAPQRIDPKDDTVESFIEAVFSVPPRRE